MIKNIIKLGMASAFLMSTVAIASAQNKPEQSSDKPKAENMMKKDPDKQDKASTPTKQGQ